MPSNDYPYMRQSGEAQAKRLVMRDQASSDESNSAVSAIWSKRLVPSASCPVIYESPSGIHQEISAYGERHLTEAAAVRNALEDLHNGRAKIYLPAIGAGEFVCKLAITLSTQEVQVTLLLDRFRDSYGDAYVAEYNNAVLKQVSVTH